MGLIVWLFKGLCQYQFSLLERHNTSKICTFIYLQQRFFRPTVNGHHQVVLKVDENCLKMERAAVLDEGGLCLQRIKV